MDRRQTERITSPALALAAVACAALIVAYPDRAVLWLVPAPVVAAIGCLLGVQTALRIQPRATGAAVVFAIKAAFWLGTAIFLIALYRN
jgi:hypothetical protein